MSFVSSSMENLLSRRIKYVGSVYCVFKANLNMKLINFHFCVGNSENHT